jgi:ATP/ADP translocase
MKSLEKSPGDTMNLKFYPALRSKAKVAFNNRKTYQNYFRKLAQEQGIGFLIGIAFGVNLILLLQMSEDIISKLSETLTNSVIGIIAILSTIIVGVTIIYTQKKTYRRIRTLIERQHKTVDDGGG